MNRDALKADPIRRNGSGSTKWSTPRAKPDANGLGDAARQELVKLQSGDAENLKIWREMIALSEKQFDEIYSRLGVKFDHTLGESFYNPRLKPLVEELLAKGIARESEGAMAIFFDDIPQLKEHPALIRKSDGGFNYTTTDLATLEYRLENLAAGRNHLRHRRTAAIAFPATFRRVPQMAADSDSELQSAKTGPRLVRLDSGRRRQAVQNAQRRNGEAGGFAGRSGRTGASKSFPKRIRICRKRNGAKSRAWWAWAR